MGKYRSVKKPIHYRLLWGLIPAALFFLYGCATGGPKQPAPAGNAGPRIEAVNVTSFGGEMTVVEVVSDKTAPFTAFQLVSPPRIVMDIQAVPTQTLDRVKRVDDGNLVQVRLEEGKEKDSNSRMVLTLARPVEYKAATRRNIITLTLTPKKEAAGEKARAVEPMRSVSPTETTEASQEKMEPKEPRIFFKPGAGGRLTRVLGVDFTMLDHGKSRLLVTTDRKVRYELDRKGPKTLVLSLDGATIPPLLMRRLDSSYFEGAVDRVKATYSGPEKRVDLAILLREMVPFHLDQTDKGIRIDFGKTDVAPREKRVVPLALKEGAVKTTPLAQAATQMQQAAQPMVSAAAPAPVRKYYTGKKMTMDFVNADVTNILRLIGEVSGLNIIWGPEVKGKVSMRLKNVPWDQAFDLVLMNNNLGKRREGNVIWVTTAAKLAKIEAEEERKRREAEKRRRKLAEAARKAKLLEPLRTEYLALDFAKAAEVKKHIVVSKRGSISVDKRTNTLILRDVAANIEEARKVVKRFDTPVKQIMISARIVDASTNFSRDLGVRWNSIEGQHRGTTSLSWSGKPLWAPQNTETNFTAGSDVRYGGSFSTNAPDGWSGNIGLNFAKLTTSALGGMALDASLALAETEGKVRIISAPKVLASNGEKAAISRGDIIYKDVVTADQIDTKELKATLSLTV
ncbi:MAG: secretin and TonB N-terminal domain-containing protein, partial [Deltaproteobacteria bacterium]|nr:secretin and TonB N-terminal domain-containing protein [Deltaproteobacteria bacterium]